MHARFITNTLDTCMRVGLGLHATQRNYKPSSMRTPISTVSALFNTRGIAYTCELKIEAKYCRSGLVAKSNLASFFTRSPPIVGNIHTSFSVLAADIWHRLLTSGSRDVPSSLTPRLHYFVLETSISSSCLSLA
jgi:hypothetical protein